MRGVVWCIWFVGVGAALVPLGLALDAERTMAIGAGLIAVVG
ncbi:hypothetical protein [Azohydromonas sp.]|nr:hypothetical protein [Azohydromonas sp.]